MLVFVLIFLKCHKIQADKTAESDHISDSELT